MPPWPGHTAGAYSTRCVTSWFSGGPSVIATTAAVVSAFPALCLAAPGDGGDSLEQLRARFATPPATAGTTTLWWLNGRLSRDEILEQMVAMRDQCGFAGVAPLPLLRMNPPTDPAYLTDEYFELYHCILDTADELGMTVVFYDDCDFPSDTAGHRMREAFPDDLLKYLERGVITVHGPGTAALSLPTGKLMSAVATNAANGERRVVTSECEWHEVEQPFAGGSVGFREATNERAEVDYLRVVGPDQRALFESEFAAGLRDWDTPGQSRIADGRLIADDCGPIAARGFELPGDFTLRTRLRVTALAAGIAFGCRGADDFYFWQLNTQPGALRPHVKKGGYQLLETVSYPFERNRWYEVELRVHGATVETFIDGEFVARHRVDAATRQLRWEAPAGDWELQAFVCATVPNTQFVDYMDPEAVRRFLSLTYDDYAKRFPEHFGTTIRMTFFDDLSAMHTPDCRMWTPRFNDEFEARYGYSPEAYYPALWGDIGADTAAARAQLLETRSALFAEGYPKTTQEWCERRGVHASGHPAASYDPDPIQSPGDGLLFYKHQGYPLTDYIHYFDHGIDGFKIPASAAWNYDKPLVVCETYGNFNPESRNDASMLYRAAIELYGRGINCILPHGTWWDADKTAIVPEISWRNPRLGPELPRYNQWTARCEGLLRAGRHVADIGIVYPIDDMASRYTFDIAPNWGKEPLPGTDYYEISRLLTGEIRRDFTLLHPEVIDERCRVDGSELVLDNEVNRERYRLVILPACRTIRLSSIEKLKRFHDRGGHVIATTCLPEKSVEFGHDADVRRIAEALFGPEGHGVFVEKPDEQALLAALDGLGMAWDVRLDGVTEIPRVVRSVGMYGELKHDPDWYEGGGRLCAYIHRSVGDAELYFIGNASDLTVSADVALRGDLQLEAWDPHTGEIRPLESQRDRAHGERVTRFRLELPALRSVFVVGTRG